MTTNDELLAELRAIRVRLDQLAAHFVGRQTTSELLYDWDCGHRHATRGEAVACKKRQQESASQRALRESSKALFEGKTSDNLRVPERPIDALVVIGDPGPEAA